MTAALFPERYACPTCHGDETVPAHPDDPGDGWRRLCPLCWPQAARPFSGDAWPKYDPEHAEIPY